jgi:hypothetical protein
MRPPMHGAEISLSLSLLSDRCLEINVIHGRKNQVCRGRVRVSYVNKTECNREGKKKQCARTQLHTFYRLSFVYSQGLCPMELDVEQEGRARRRRRRRRRKKRRKEKDSQTQRLNGA